MFIKNSLNFVCKKSKNLNFFKSNRAYVNKTFKQPTFYEGIRPLFSTVYLFVFQLIWIKYSKVNILHLEPRAFFWLTGTLFANIAVSSIFICFLNVISQSKFNSCLYVLQCRLIIAQMTKTRCQIFNSGLVLLTITVFLFTCPLSDKYKEYLTSDMEIKALYLNGLFITLSHIHYGVCVVKMQLKCYITLQFCIKFSFLLLFLI